VLGVKYSLILPERSKAVSGEQENRSRIRNKYSKFMKQRWYAAYRFLQRLPNDYPNLIAHWQYEMGDRFPSPMLFIKHPAVVIIFLPA